MKKGLNRGEKGEDGSDGVSRGFSNEKKVDDGFSRNFPLYERMLPRQNVSTEVKKIVSTSQEDWTKLLVTVGFYRCCVG
jgi:hypothetical protein